jgi:subtilase family serine protease
MAVFAVFALPACSSGVASTQVPATGAAVANTASGAQRKPQSARAFAASCAAATTGNGTCTNIERAGATVYGPTTPAQQVPGLHPADLQSAYQLPSTTAGSGQTIGIVVVGSDPNLAADLAVYRSTFGLPACTSANGCLNIITGLLTSAANADWSHEASIDTDMASAVCPNCKLLVVEMATNTALNLALGDSLAVRRGATVINNSFAIPESASVPSETNTAWSHPGIPIVAAAGDQAYGTVNWPAAATNVIAVGATTLTPNAATSRGWSETAWSGTASGCSGIAVKPAWQTDTSCSMRTVADIAAVGDPSTPVAVYDSYQDNGWVEMGGTSVATPIVAGVYALAGNGAQLTGASSLYAHPGGLNKVSAGSNGSCSPLYLCTAGSGYSGPAGVGSPKGIAAF